MHVNKDNKLMTVEACVEETLEQAFYAYQGEPSSDPEVLTAQVKTLINFSAALIGKLADKGLLSTKEIGELLYQDLDG